MQQIYPPTLRFPPTNVTFALAHLDLRKQNPLTTFPNDSIDAGITPLAV